MPPSMSEGLEEFISGDPSTNLRPKFHLVQEELSEEYRMASLGSERSSSLRTLNWGFVHWEEGGWERTVWFWGSGGLLLLVFQERAPSRRCHAPLVIQ